MPPITYPTSCSRPQRTRKELLLKEGIPESKIFVTGNTIVDAVNENLKIARDSDILEKLGVTSGRYMLSTIHRQENTDDKQRLSEIFKGLGMVSENQGCLSYCQFTRGRGRCWLRLT